MIGTLLFLVPILRNKGERHWSRRPWSIDIVLLTVIMVGSLWIKGIKSPTSPNFQANRCRKKSAASQAATVAVGAHVFYEKACLNCHLIDGYGGRQVQRYLKEEHGLTWPCLRSVNIRGNARRGQRSRAHYSEAASLPKSSPTM